MALSGTLQLTSDYVPGYRVSNFSNSAPSRRTLALLPCSSCLVHKLCVENGHLNYALNKTSFVCQARNNPDFSRNNKFRGRNRQSEDRDGLNGNGFEDSDSKNGSVFSLSNSPKLQATSSPGPSEKEIVNLFRKVQAQLRARASAKKEDNKIEKASKGLRGNESETVDSLLKLLKKHSGEQSRKKVSNFNVEKGDHDDAERQQDHSSSRNKDHNATRPMSRFRRNSPVPRHKSQVSYSSDAVFDEATSYSVTWTQKKDHVEPHEPETEPVYEPESEPGLSILESEPELMRPESFYQEEEDHDVAVDELSDDESLDAEEETTKEEDLSALKLIELRAIAKSKGLKGFSKMKKAELVEMINKRL